MSWNRVLQDELDELLGSLRDGFLTDDQSSRLDAILGEHSEAVDRYVSYVALCSALRRREAVDASRVATLRFMPVVERVASDEAPPSPPRAHVPAHQWFSDARMAVAAAVLLVVSLTIAVIVDTQNRRAAKGVAVLVSAVDAVWDAPAMRSDDWIGRPLPEGRLVLREGFVQLRFHDGAVAVVEGPAELNLISTGRAFLQRGKIRAYVPEAARGFTVDAPGVSVVDLGTEFGLQVLDAGGAEVHVFEGEVEVGDGAQARTPRAALAAGEAVSVDSLGRSQKKAADKQAFVGRRQMLDLVALDQAKRFERWKAFRDRLGSESGLLLGFTFEDASSGIVRNLGSAATAGRLSGCAPAPGRWSGKQALDFGGQGADGVSFELPGTHASMSFSAWVQVDRLPHAFNTLMLTEGWDRGEPHWQIRRDGRLILGVGGRTGGQRGYAGDYASAARVVDASTLGRWIHLATVYDGASHRVTHYLNGRSVGSAPMREYLPLTVGRARVGCWDRGGRTFDGRMGELFIHDRALDADGVAAIYAAGQPTPQWGRSQTLGDKP